MRSLEKKYGSAVVVDNIDFEVRSGEVFALLGPNGAGKTTTVEILEGVRRRTGGDVRVLGYDPAEDDPSWRARIGVVPQTTGAYLDLTVREVVEHFAAFYPAPLPPDEVIDMVGLTSQRRKQAQQLSGGQLRRLDVAVGVVGDPDLIFLDEPTTGLDPVARREAWDLVRHFADRGKTTVLTTHYLDEVEALAQRAAIIVAGKIVETGPISELGGRKTDRSVVEFVASGALDGLPLPPLPPGSQAREEARRVSVHTHRPTETLAALLPWAHAAGVRELDELRIHRPTLEEVYLQLIKDREEGTR
ncbi:ABC transporter ATP-binding protein [Streptosporangium longisporum]|uniref:ABC transporter ATP-binding protein n=1 Tax=Streptosporangium longisporum TaxID=46187 RepID=A0ABP6KEK4_9ACTN